MVFSSIPLYLDPPNWQQHQNHHQFQASGSGNNENNQHLIIPPPPPPVPQNPPQVGVGGGGGGGGGRGGGPPIRPNSMAEQARREKIPLPDAPLKCPRCESTNTKFCYFNNYSLSQPRHFCKTCRRYWTRGGALRNVPVGGGCRRNKRSSSTKSASSTGGGHGGGVAAAGAAPPSMVGGGGGMTSFMASLQNLGNLGLPFGGSLNHHPLGGLVGISAGEGSGGGAGAGDGNQQLDYMNNQQVLQFPNFLGGFEIPTGSSSPGLYTTSFQNDHNHQVGVGDDDDDNHDHNHNHDRININNPKSSSTTMMISQLAPVKMEDNRQGLNLAKQLIMGNNQFWGNSISSTTAPTSMWTDLSGLNSSSTSHLL